MRRINIDEDFIKDEYQSGKTLKDIADQLGCDKSTVAARLKEAGIPIRSSGQRRADVLNKKFGQLLVVKEATRKPGEHLSYICQCDCGNLTERTASMLLNRNGIRMCMLCRNKFISDSKWKGCGELSGDFWDTINRTAQKRSLEFSVTIEEAWQLFLDQNRKCALSGIELVFSNGTKRKKGAKTASLDRIDSQKGYVSGNIQWVHKELNIMKWHLSHDDFLKWCRLVVEHNK